MGNTCEAYRDLIEEAAGGGAGHAPALGAHLAACAACHDFARGREALLALLGGLEKVSAPDDFEFRLRARMARQRAAESSWLRRLRFAPGLAAAAVAACLVTASALYFRASQGADNSFTARQVAPADSTSTTDGSGSQRQESAGVDETQRGADEVAAERQGEESRQALPAAPVGPVGRRDAPRSRRAQREDTFGVREAPGLDVSRGRQLAANSATPTLELRTSPETLRVVMRDEHGGSVVLPMRSVSFGAQGPVGSGARVVRASFADKEGVW